MGAEKYDTVVDLGRENNSHSLMVALVGSGKRVLDLGCATGYLARSLVERGNTVSGVEVDPAAAEKARPDLEQLVVGDLTVLDLAAELGEGRFDVVVIGDVLEHLVDPLPILRQVRPLLAPGGYVVISIPNIAHASVRLALLAGRFDYTPTGLLDTTHLRFFTRDSVSTLLHDAGLAAAEFLRTTASPFETELRVRADQVSPEVLAQVMADPDAETYQFVIRAVPDDAEMSVTRMRETFEQRIQRLTEQAATETARLHGVVADLQAQLDARQTQLTAMDDQVSARDTEVARLREHLAALERTKAVRAARTVARLRSGR